MLQLSISVAVCSEYIFFLKVPGFLGLLGLSFFPICFGAEFELLWNFLRLWWSHCSLSRLGWWYSWSRYSDLSWQQGFLCSETEDLPLELYQCFHRSLGGQETWRMSLLVNVSFSLVVGMGVSMSFSSKSEIFPFRTSVCLVALFWFEGENILADFQLLPPCFTHTPPMAAFPSPSQASADPPPALLQRHEPMLKEQTDPFKASLDCLTFNPSSDMRTATVNGDWSKPLVCYTATACWFQKRWDAFTFLFFKSQQMCVKKKRKIFNRWKRDLI